MWALLALAHADIAICTPNVDFVTPPAGTVDVPVDVVPVVALSGCGGQPTDFRVDLYDATGTLIYTQGIDAVEGRRVVVLDGAPLLAADSDHRLDVTTDLAVETSAHFTTGVDVAAALSGPPRLTFPHDLAWWRDGRIGTIAEVVPAFSPDTLGWVGVARSAAPEEALAVALPLASDDSLLWETDEVAEEPPASYCLAAYQWDAAGRVLESEAACTRNIDVHTGCAAVSRGGWAAVLLAAGLVGRLRRSGPSPSR